MSEMETDEKVAKAFDENKCQAKTVTVYWQRWYILALFSFFTMWSCAVWNTFSPIAASAKEVTTS